MESKCNIQTTNNLTLDTFVQCILEDIAFEIQEYEHTAFAEREIYAVATAIAVPSPERITLQTHDYLPPPLHRCTGAA